MDTNPAANDQEVKTYNLHPFRVLLFQRVDTVEHGERADRFAALQQLYAQNPSTELATAIQTLQQTIAVQKALAENMTSDGNIAAGANALKQSAEALSSGLTTLDNGGKALSAGAEKLSTSTDLINGGAQKLSKGTADLDNGITTLTAGGSKLSDGINALAAGIDRLAAGAGELDGGLGTGIRGCICRP